MNADEFRAAYDKRDKMGSYLGEPTGKLRLLARGIEEILRRLDEQQEEVAVHMPIGWNDDQKMCNCGRTWPHA